MGIGECRPRAESAARPALEERVAGDSRGLRAASGFTHAIVTSVRSPGTERAMLGSVAGRVNAD
jgi:hypothetical protein